MADQPTENLNQATGSDLTRGAELFVHLEGENQVKRITYGELCDRILADLGPVVTP
jgi:hypothetical protein